MNQSASPEPTSHEEVQKTAEELLAAKDAVGAEALLRDGLQRWPDRFGIQLKLARALEMQGRRDDARAVIASAVGMVDKVPAWAIDWVAYFDYSRINGVMIDLAPDVITPYMKNHLTKGTYENSEANFLSEVIRPNDVILEVGGGIGFIATYALLAEPSARVVSYEANPSLIPVAQRTMELNEVEFEMRNAVLGTERGVVDFFVNPAFWASSATHDYGGSTTIEVPVEPVADVLAQDAFTMLVMDIEGGELELVPLMDLSGIDRFVLETHPVITGAKPVKRLLRQLKRQYGLESRAEQGGVHLLTRQ